MKYQPYVPPMQGDTPRPSCCVQDNGDLWLEWVVNNQRFILVYDVIPEASSWVMTKGPFHDGGQFYSSSGKLKDADVAALFKEFLAANQPT